MMIHAPLLHGESHAIPDIAEMIRRDGQRVYSTVCPEGCAWQASLCGLTAGFALGGTLKILQAHDLHIVIRSIDTANDGAEDTEAMLVTRYIKGNAATLTVWHRHLAAYRRSMRTGLASAA